MSDFEGFPAPTKNFFSLPNEMINIIARIDNMAELKVIIYVIRHTWGYHEYGIVKTISVDEFMHGRRRADGTRIDNGTGLSNHSVIKGLRAAVEHGYLICEVDDSDLARVKKSYTLKMIVASEQPSPREQSSPHVDVAPGEESTASYEASSPSYEESSHRSEKDTKERHLKKDKEESTGVALATPAHALSDTENDSQQGDVNGTNSNRHSDLPSHHGCSHPDHAHLTANPTQKSQQAQVTQGDEHAHETDAALPDVPALDANRLRSGMEAVAAPAIGEALTKGDTDDLSASGDVDRGSARHSLHAAIAPTAQETAGLSAAAAAYAPADGRTPRLSEVDTSRRTSPPNGAVGSGTGTSGPRASGRRGKAQQQDVTQALSLQGAQVKEWMETIKGRKLRMTPKNILAWNALAEEEDISFENLRDAIAKLENIKWVQDHDYVIDEHVLVQEDGNFTFAKGLELVKRGRKPKAASPSAEQFTSKTLDKERNDKRIAEMIEKSKMLRAAREAAQAQAIQ